MELIFPSYFESFHCIASACPDSCCKEWAVQLDFASAARYRDLPGDLGDALRSAMTVEDGETILSLTNDRRCPMWQQDGLCRIQAQLGEDWLCETCRDFPRLRHDYGDFVEMGLELSCPEAASIILADTTCQFITRELPGGDAPDYDTEAMAILRHSRQEILTFLKDTTYGVADALAILLLYAHGIQNRLDGGDDPGISPADLLRQARSFATSGSAENLLAFYKQLEILTPTWRSRLNNPTPSQWTESHRALARYFVQRYWLQAVSDYDLISRAKLTIASCLVVRFLGADTLQTAQLYSKEIENDVDNLEAILDAAYTCPALTDRSLLGLLLP